MLNKAITVCVGLILLALVVKGFAAGNGYLADVERATQARSAAYASMR